MKATGELRKWWYHPVFDVYIGRVYGDIKRRFKDGSTIHTSKVVREEYFDDHTLVFTLNSVYICYHAEEKREDLCASQQLRVTTT